MKYLKFSIAAVITTALVISPTQAALINNGNGLLYDTALNITWLQDANYAHTSGYGQADSSGKMDWATATTWASTLTYQGFSDWRLASNTAVNGFSFTSLFKPIAYDGKSDYGYNITSQFSELAYMYYVNLQLKSQYDTNGVLQTGYGSQNNNGLVTNLHNYAYWSGTSLSGYPGNAWNFNYYNGKQDVNSTDVLSYAWAVHAGNISVVPLPSAFLFFISGMMGLLFFRFPLNSLIKSRRN